MRLWDLRTPVCQAVLATPPPHTHTHENPPNARRPSTPHEPPQPPRLHRAHVGPPTALPRPHAYSTPPYQPSPHPSPPSPGPHRAAVGPPHPGVPGRAGHAAPPVAAFDQQGLVFAVGAGRGVVKLYDAAQFQKGPFETFVVGVWEGLSPALAAKRGRGPHSICGAPGAVRVCRDRPPFTPSSCSPLWQNPRAMQPPGPRPQSAAAARVSSLFPHTPYPDPTARPHPTVSARNCSRPSS